MEEAALSVLLWSVRFSLPEGDWHFACCVYCLYIRGIFWGPYR